MKKIDTDAFNAFLVQRQINVLKKERLWHDNAKFNSFDIGISNMVYLRC